MPDHGRPAGVPARAVPVDPARVPRVLRRARSAARSSILGHQTYLQVADLPIGVAVHPRDVGPRRVRRDARGLVVGLEVPAARLGARVGAAALATKPRSASPIARRAHPGEHALDARRSSRKQAWDGVELDRQRRLVLAARASSPFVIFLIAAIGRDEPPAVRPRRGRAGARRRVQHRVHRHPVRDLLPRRVHERHHDVGDRGHAVPRRPVGPGARVPARATAGSTCGSCRCSGSW